MKNSILFCMAVWVVCLAQICANAQDIKPANQSPVTLHAQNYFDSFDIQITWNSSVTPKDIVVAGKPSDVSLDNRSNSSFKDAIKFEKFDNPALFIRVTVDLRRLDTPGTYQVTMLVFPSKDKQGIPVPLTFIRPPAKLDTVYSLHIYIDGNDVRKAPFALKETSGLSSIHKLNLSPVIFPGASDADFITFPGNIDSIAAGSINKIKYDVPDTLIDHLPLGRTTGTMLIKASELSGPTAVPAEIIRRHSICWLFGALIAGLLLGGFVRHFLKSRRAVEQARLKGYELLRQLKDEYVRVSDRNFRKKIDEAAAELANTIQDGGSIFEEDPEKKIAGSITKATNAYNEAKTTLTGSLQAAEDNLNALSGYFEGPDSTISRVIKPTAADYGAARNALTRKDAATANQLIANIVTFTNKFITGYIAGQGTLLDDLNAVVPDFLPQNTKTGISNISENIKKGLSTIFADKEKVADVVSMLKALSIVQSNVEAVFAYIDKTVNGMVGSIKLDDSDPAVVELKNSFNNWASGMRTAAAYPFGVFDRDLTSALNTAWSSVSARLSAQRVTRGSEEKEESPFKPGDLPSWQAAAGLVQGHLSSPQTDVLGSIVISYNRAMKNWLIYSLGWFLILGFVLCLIAYKLYGPAFIGKCDELITIFFFGFTIDISLDNILNLMKDKKLVP